MTLALTVGTNTYLTLADAKLYMERRYEPTGAWAAAADATLNILLANATLIIDRQMWRQSKTAATQALEFPRGGDSTIPTEVTYACVEQALHLLLAGCATDQAALARGLASASLGAVSETYRAGGTDELCPAARKLLGFWWVGGAAIV